MNVPKLMVGCLAYPCAFSAVFSPHKYTFHWFIGIKLIDKNQINPKENWHQIFMIFSKLNANEVYLQLHSTSFLRDLAHLYLWQGSLPARPTLAYYLFCFHLKP